MFRGLYSVSVDAKGRLAVPSRFREILTALDCRDLVLTLNPWDRSLWLYPLPHWSAIDEKLASLSDFDTQSRRTKQILRGYATDCACDNQGRILLSSELREVARIERQVVLLGQGNKLEIWDADAWRSVRDSWLDDVGAGTTTTSLALESLSL